MDTETLQTKSHYLSIKLDEELFALSVHTVLEVLEKQHVTKVPNVPEFIKGVINFRGEILPVIEARQKFNMPQRPTDAKYVIVVLDLKIKDRNLQIGIVADGVNDVLELDSNEIKSVPEMGTNYNTEFLSGMVKIDSGFLMLLNVERVFSSEEINLINNSQLA